MESRTCGISVLLALAIAWTIAVISPPVPAVAGETPDVVRLLRAISANEYKVHDVRSMYVRFAVKCCATPDEIAQNLARLQARNPGVPATEFTAERFPELRREAVIGEWERAFDAKRLRLFDHVKNDIDLKVWDGKTATFYQKYESFKDEHYSYVGNPKMFFGDHSFDSLSWLRLGIHSFWWNSVPVPTTAQKELCCEKRPEDYRCVAKRLYRGRQCFVLEAGEGGSQLFVDVEEHRLRGILQFFVPRDRTPNPAQLRELSERVSGKKFSTDAELGVWYNKLPVGERARFQSRCEDAIRKEFGQPFSDFFMDEYREIAPGFWFPMKQGYVSFGSKKGRSFETACREFQVVEIKVNQPLPDSLFTMEMKDGVRVVDTRGQSPSVPAPWLTYPYKKNRSKAEWQAILDAHQKVVDQARKEQAERDKRIGQPALEFAESEWLNSKPLKLTDLRGKVVILDFWAAGCGACRDDYPIMNHYHDSQATSGIVFIGGHASRNTRAEIQEIVKQYAMKYPIYVDTPSGADGFGVMTGWYGVLGIPHAVVIDRDGKVAGHGRLQEVLVKARGLANQH